MKLKYTRHATGIGIIYDTEENVRIRKPFGYNEWRVEIPKEYIDENGSERRKWEEISRFPYLQAAKKAAEMYIADKETYMDYLR